MEKRKWLTDVYSRTFSELFRVNGAFSRLTHAVLGFAYFVFGKPSCTLKLGFRQAACFPIGDKFRVGDPIPRSRPMLRLAGLLARAGLAGFRGGLFGWCRLRAWRLALLDGRQD